LKVLVTGGCGFLGSHICEFYIKKGDEVVVLDNLTKHELVRTDYNVIATRAHIQEFLLKLGVKIIKGDIRNDEDIVTAAKNCDYIIHTAAQPALTIGIEKPKLDLMVNVVGTFNVLEEARRSNIPVAICSSIHVYGNKINESLKEAETRFLLEPPTIDESHPIVEGTLTPLHTSKRSAELYAQAYIDTYGLEAAVFRLTGLYGPRQFGSEDHGWVANFAIKNLIKKQIKLFGSGKQVRDILYAEDAARAFDAFYSNKNKSGIYNIGGGVERAISLVECISLIEKITGEKTKIIPEPKRLGDLWYFVCNISKAKKKLGWQPKTSNETGLTNLIDWIKDNLTIFFGENR